MITGIGIDTVDIHRFCKWKNYSYKKLKRIFSEQEIAYCLQLPLKSAERFAVRFAAREAFFKAWSSSFPESRVPFLTICRAITISQLPNRAPIIQIDHSLLEPPTPLRPLLSLSHTPTLATAIVLIQIDT